VGSFATQIARNVLRLSNVIVTASRPETIEWCKGQGATHIINHRKPLKEQIEALGVTVDYALICYDTNAYLAEVVDIVRPFGKIAAIVDVDSDMPFGGAMLKAISFHWEFMFAKPMYEYDMLSQGLALDKIADYIDKGSLKRVDTKVYDDLNVKNLREVHETVENGRAIGKIVLNVSDRSFQ
jgi:NADPH:quinone reductase-like Zn-dependent oxidoreductase